MAWLPSDSGAYVDCIAWYDASDASTITLSGSDVTQWDDKKNSNNLTVGTGSPISGTTINGLATVDFDGTDYLRKASATYVGASGYNYAIMVLEPDGGSDQFIFGYGVSDVGGETFSATTNDNSANDQFTGRLFNGAVDSGSTWSGVTLASFGIAQGAQQNTMEIRHDGTDTAHGAGSTSTITVQTGPEIGLGGYNRLSGGAYGRYNGRIAEFLFFDTEPTTAEKEELEGYLAHKWGIEAKLPGGHTYKNTPPVIGSSTGTASAAGIGAATNAQSGAANGVGAGSGVGASTAAQVGASSGASTVSGVSSGGTINAGAGSSTGTGAATGVGAPIFAGVGASSGAASVSGIGAPIFSGVGISSGIAVPLGVSAATSAQVGLAAGVGSVLGVAEAQTPDGIAIFYGRPKSTPSIVGAPASVSFIGKPKASPVIIGAA